MDYEDIPQECNCKYKITCNICEMETTVCTQTDIFPEYQTEVYVQCHCGNYLEFILPVN